MSWQSTRCSCRAATSRQAARCSHDSLPPNLHDVHAPACLAYNSVQRPVGCGALADLQYDFLQGRAVMLVLAARHDMGTRRLEETNRLIVYVLDNAAAMSSGQRANPLGKFLCLFDLSGVAGMSIYKQVYVCYDFPSLLVYIVCWQ
jgi:hypothetical protein